MSEELQITHEDGDSKGGFYLLRGDEKLGEITYKKEDGNLVFDRTWVDDSLRGQGRAGQLFGVAMDWVRAEGHKVVPVCSYVQARFDKDESLADLKA